MTYRTLIKTLGATALLSLTAGAAVQAQTILTTSNGIIRNSLCVGGDCQSGISFSDSTIIVKENNTRIKFADTSVAASFPRNDWELEANSQTNGGPNRFSLLDCGEGSNDGGCSESINVFSVEANAGSNALYVDDGGRVGFGTGSPVVELHVVDGDTPTLRLEQNNAAGFAPQTFDVAGNETNFFVRDVTNGSALPFRIQPGAATNTIYIANDEQVGIGTSSPAADLHIFHPDSDNFSTLRLTNPQGANEDWDIRTTTAGGFAISKAGTGQVELEIDVNGNVTIRGDLTITGTCTGC